MLQKIFHADDDEDDAVLFEEAIKKQSPGIQYVYFSSGLSFIEYINDGHVPDLFVIDLNMPRLDGKTCISHIRRKPSLEHIPILVLTTSNSKAEAKACLSLGANYYIVKPNTMKGMFEIGKAITMGEVKSSI